MVRTTGETKRKIELYFPAPRNLSGSDVQLLGSGESVGDRVKLKLDEFLALFEGYRVESITLSLEGGVETSGITKLFVSASGQAGCTVVLKPKVG